MPKLTINGIEIEVEKGTSILQAAEQLGIEVPRFCYHDKLSVPANCRMCLVEVSPGPPKPAASCAMACGDGMVVKTDSDMVKKARKGVMEMLLINHPLDCPICDQGGECDLQDQAMAYGFDRSRYYENKRAKADPDLGPLIGTSMNRCINCTRCIRFAEEIAGVPVLGQFHRGEEAEIGTFIDKLVDTELSGNLIDVCPVGALTSKPYAFKARSWELRKTESIDVHDALGSNIRVDVRGREVMRILPRLNEDINEEWIDDRTRFAYDGLHHGRIDRPYIRDEKSGKLIEASWDQAFAYIAHRMKGIHGTEIAGLVGDLVDLESTVALKDFLTFMGSPHMDCRTDGSRFDVENRSGYLFNSTIAGIENADAIVLVGTNPRTEAVLVNARIRKMYLEKRVKVYVVGEAVDLTYPYTYVGTDLAALDKLKLDAKAPMIIAGSGLFQREDGEAVHEALYQAAKKLGATFNFLHRAASRVGALEVGFVPQKKGKNFHDIVEGTKNGQIKALYLLGADEFDARQAIGWQTFVIYQGHHGDHGAARADVVLPGCAYTEKDAIYVNTEGRPQFAKRAASAPGEAREDWKILRALSTYLGFKLAYDTPVQLRARIAQDWPHLVAFNTVLPAKAEAFGTKGKVEKGDLKSPVKNFYLANAICRASNTMRQCTSSFQNKELLEAAE
jgi:NADH-quinone oxidoreductase subunit G